MKETLDSPQDFQRALLRSVHADTPPPGGADALARKLGLGALAVTGAVVAASGAATATKVGASKLTAASLVSKLFGAVATTGFALGVVTTSVAFGAYEWHTARARTAAGAAISAPSAAAPVAPITPSLAVVFVPPPSSSELVPAVQTTKLPPAPVERSAHPITSPAPSRSPSSLPPEPPAGKVSAELAAEVQLLSKAKELLDARNTLGAQAALESYKRDFPNGSFHTEALALEIDVASAEGRSDDVKQLGGRFLGSYPTSPHVARVRAALVRATAP